MSTLDYYKLNKLTMKNLAKLFTISIFLLTLISCDDDDDLNNGPSITTFTAAINGTSEVPANNSMAKGTATLLFNNTTKVFTVTVTHDLGSAATMGHIHKAAAGSNGGVIFPFTSLGSPITYTSAALTAEQEADLMANSYYVNLHTAAFPGGEIRGQLMKGATTKAK